MGQHCGTNAGWLVHRRLKEQVCRPCAKAREQHVKDSCGLYAGWMLHRRMGTPICERCRLARNDYQNNRPRKPRMKR